MIPDTLTGQALKDKIKASALYDKGLCRDKCGRPREGDSTRCRKCLDRAAATNRRIRKRHSDLRLLTRNT